MHVACAEFERTRQELLRGNALTWVYDADNGSTMEELQWRARVRSGCLFATDGSAKGAVGGSAVAYFADGGSDRGPKACATELLSVQVRGRPADVAVSYHNELLALILMLIAAPGGECIWVGDNKSVQDLYKAIAVDGWVYTDRQLEKCRRGL